MLDSEMPSSVRPRRGITRDDEAFPIQSPSLTLVNSMTKQPVAKHPKILSYTSVGVQYQLMDDWKRDGEGLHLGHM